MTDLEYEVMKLKKEIAELKHLRQLDMAEMVRLRRMIESMAEKGETA